MIENYTPFKSGPQKWSFPGKYLLKEGLLTKICCCLFILLPTLASAQNVITGEVKDNKGIIVICAAVSENSVQNAAVTDVNGKFSITLPPCQATAPNS